MSWWNRDLRESGDFDDLAHPPSSGGWVKMSLLGFLFPAWMIYLGVTAWLNQRAYLPGRGTTGGEWLTGDAARSLAIVHAGIAIFAHARWFWGLLPNEGWFEKLTILGGLMIIGGILAAIGLTWI